MDEEKIQESAANDNSPTAIQANADFVPQTTFDRHTQTTYLIMGGVILVLFVGFLTLLFSLAALLMQAWSNRQPDYQALVNQVQKQTTEINNLSNIISSSTLLRK